MSYNKLTRYCKTKITLSTTPANLKEDENGTNLEYICLMVKHGYSLEISGTKLKKRELGTYPAHKQFLANNKTKN